MTLDLLIRGGEVHDGTGRPGVGADIGIRGDRIAAIGDLGGIHAREVIDARGRVVCPGFIDVHTHSDLNVLRTPSAPSRVFQGITTDIMGNCGSSQAPSAEARRVEAAETEAGEPFEWRTVADYRACVERARPAVNVALLIGHGSLRAAVMGEADRRADPQDLQRMVAALERALEEGGCGLSTGLLYAPGRYADLDEIAVLATVAARHGGVYATHLRNEGAGLPGSIEEALEIGERARIRVQISHLKASGRANWPLIGPAIERIRRAIDAGQPVTADRYPYIASSTDLRILLPADEAVGTDREILARLRDPVARARIRTRIARERSDDYWRTVVLAVSAADGGRWQGRPLIEVAESWGAEPAETLLQILEADRLQTQAIFFSMNEEQMTRVLAEPWVMIGSDGSIRATEGPTAAGHPHPRSYGTFARFLRMSLDGHTVPLPEAIRKMTSLPAATFGLRDRGELRPGAHADVVVFDPDRVRDRATYEHPRQYAEGIEWVIVNGVVTLRDGRLTGLRGGRFLAGGGRA